MRAVTGKKKDAASANTMGRFEKAGCVVLQDAALMQAFHLESGEVGFVYTGP
jgi:hypothetical protein